MFMPPTPLPPYVIAAPSAGQSFMGPSQVTHSQTGIVLQYILRLSNLKRIFKLM